MIWRTVDNDGLPPVDGETVFVGVNAIGYCGCFNEMVGTQCYYVTAEEEVSILGGLAWWAELELPGELGALIKGAE